MFVFSSLHIVCADFSNCNTTPHCTEGTGLLNISVANMDCQSLTQASATDLSTCGISCCENSGCTVYQWCPPGKQCDGITGNNTDGECWIGQYSDCSGTRDGWLGFGK